MSKRAVGGVLVILGLALAVGAFYADRLGVGGFPGVGWKQQIGMLLGVFAAMLGSYSIGKGSRSS